MPNPRYDLRNDKIIDAPPGSLVWWHERGHQVGRRFLLFAEAIEPHLIIIGWGSLALGIRWASLIAWCLFLGLRIAAEVWAWLYAFWNVRRGLKHFFSDKRSDHIWP